MTIPAMPVRPTPYWKRAHHDWKFWLALFMMFAALGMYVMSDDLALVSR